MPFPPTRAVRVGALVCVMLGAGVGDALAATESFHWPGWTIPGTKIEKKGSLQVVEDDEAESVREVTAKDGKKTKEKVALMQRVSRRRIARSDLRVAQTPRVKWKDIVPGVYRISARVNFEGEVGLIGTPIRLAVAARHNESARDFPACDFKEAGKYLVLSMRYEVAAKGDRRCEARSSTGRPRRYISSMKKIFARAYPKSDVADELRKLPPPGAPSFLQLALILPKTKYSVKEGLPPNSLRWVRLDWIKMERIVPDPSITVRYVKAKKAWVRPGESNHFTVSLANYTTQPHKRQVVVALERGLDQRQVIHTEEVSLAPGASKTLTVPWNTSADTPVWGYEVRAEVRTGDTVESQSRDFFSLHPQVYTVHVMGSNTRTHDPFQHGESYQNLGEWFGCLSGDCARVDPKRDAWVLGMMSGGGWYTIPYARAAIAMAHERGIAQHMYLYAGGCSTPMMEMYATNPEFAAGHLVATDQIYRKIRKRENEVWAHDFAKRMPERWTIEGGFPHVEHGLNHWFPELKAKIERETVSVIRKTGFDGIRFDVGIFAPRRDVAPTGEKLPYDMDKAMEHAAKNFTDYKDTLRAVFPHFEFGANMDSWAYLEQVGNRDVTPKPPETYPEFVAFARCGGMLMDEGTMNAPFFTHYMNRYEDALWGMCEKRAVCRKYGGVYQLFSPHRDSKGHFAHDDIYWAVMIVASGSYYVGYFSAPPYSEGSIGAFITRYSEFFRSKKLRPLPKPRDKIAVDAEADIWFADTAVWQDVGPRRRYVIPLINPPVNDRMRLNKINELPPPLDDPFTVTVAIPEGYTRGEAWMLTWEPRVRRERLKARVTGRSLKVTFPGLQLFRTLVAEFTQ